MDSLLLAQRVGVREQGRGILIFQRRSCGCLRALEGAVLIWCVACLVWLVVVVATSYGALRGVCPEEIERMIDPFDVCSAFLAACYGRKIRGNKHGSFDHTHRAVNTSRSWSMLIPCLARVVGDARDGGGTPGVSESAHLRKWATLKRSTISGQTYYL